MNKSAKLLEHYKYDLAFIQSKILQLKIEYVDIKQYFDVEKRPKDCGDLEFLLLKGIKKVIDLTIEEYDIINIDLATLKLMNSYVTLDSDYEFRDIYMTRSYTVNDVNSAINFINSMIVKEYNILTIIGFLNFILIKNNLGILVLTDNNIQKFIHYVVHKKEVEMRHFLKEHIFYS